MLNIRELKKQLVRVCHLLAEKDYVSAMDGNVSARLPDGTFLATPTMLHKGFITEEDLIIVDAQGRKRSGHPERQPTSEMAMHLACYRARTDVQAVVHAHPPTAIAFTLAGISLAGCVLPEVVLTLGQIPTAPYQTTGTAALAETIRSLVETHDAILMDRHGAITVGRDLIDAFGKMEKVEHTALITWRAHTLGQVLEIPADETEHLRTLGRKYSARGTLPPACERSTGPLGSSTAALPPPSSAGLGVSTRSSAPAQGSFSAPADLRPGLLSGSVGLETIIREELLRALSQRPGL